MSVKRYMVLKVGLNDSEKTIKNACNTYKLGCISVELLHDKGSGKPTGKAKAIFLNNAQFDEDVLSLLEEIDNWRVLESEIIPSGLVLRKPQTTGHLNPVQFLREVEQLDVPSHPNFGKVMRRGGFSISSEDNGGLSFSSRHFIADKKNADDKNKHKADEFLALSPAANTKKQKKTEHESESSSGKKDKHKQQEKKETVKPEKKIKKKSKK